MPKFKQEAKEMGRSPEDVATDLGEVYFIRKDAEDEQKVLRDEFFKAATEAAASQTLARKTVTVAERSEEAAVARALKYNSGWRIVEVKRLEGTFVSDYRIVMEEDPEFIGYVAVVLNPNQDDPKRPGWKVTKTIRSGSSLVDDERMKEDDPQLYQAVTTYANADLYWSLADRFELDLETLDEWLADAGAPVVMRPLQELSEADLEAVQEYMYEGPKTVALNVSVASKDDLAGM